MTEPERKKAESPVRRKAVRAMNAVTRFRKKRCLPGEMLLLVPHCLQYSDCPHNIVGKIENCKRCGRCKIKILIELADEYGVKLYVASGGRMAVRQVKDDAVKGVVAVACEIELCEGMRASLPKPVIGVLNLRPNGPCKDTDVDISEVRNALDLFLSGVKSGSR
ncbi:MAG TPA: DUF116 domain-containing protein [Candidatus Brocadiia bacterium]|nr:DUF116 domain-containing protein [Candidatus Brocadiia bacterium]